MNQCYRKRKAYAFNTDCHAQLLYCYVTEPMGQYMIFVNKLLKYSYLSFANKLDC